MLLNLKSYKEQQPIHLLSSTLHCRRPTLTATQASPVNTEKQLSAEMFLTHLRGCLAEHNIYHSHSEARHSLSQSIHTCFLSEIQIYLQKNSASKK